MKMELVGRGSCFYPEVCRFTERVYEEEIRVSPTSSAPCYLALYDESALVGAVGIWLGTETSTFLTELYCQKQGINPVQIDPKLSLQSRRSLAEVGSLSMLKCYRKDFLAPFFCLTYAYCLYAGVKVLFLICGAHILPIFHKLGTELRYLCVPRLENYQAGEKEKAKWKQIYFAKLKPRCATVDVMQAWTACRFTPLSTPLIELGSSLLDLEVCLGSWKLTF